MIEFYLFTTIIYVFLILLLLLCVLILGFTIYRKKTDLNNNAWRNGVGVAIVGVLFSEEVDDGIKALNYEFERRRDSSGYKNYVVNELIKAKGDFSGSSGSDLILLYERLNLDRYSFGKLHKLRWHIKAKGIQELGTMQQLKYRKEIFWLANDKHELVRNEAQCAMVSFFGWTGLSFLHVIEHQMSQWHQVQLLNKLNGVKPEDLGDLKTWMESSNDSVVVFAIKLATLYNCPEVYQNVVNCLQSPNHQAKISALEYLRRMPQEDTTDRLISNYYSEDTDYRLTVIDVLKDIGSEKEVQFLITELDDWNNNVKAAAAHSISVLHPLGNSFFKTYLFADTKPWKEIFLQITNNRIA